MLSIRTILHPTDYSDLSRPAFELACSLAREYAAELVICHVAPSPLMAVEGGFEVEIPTGEAEAMTARLEHLKPENKQIRVTHRLLRGNAAEEIVRLGGDTNADLIVMSTHGRSGFSRLLMGSVAEAVVRKAGCPVVTMKTPRPADQPKTAARGLLGSDR